MPVIDDKDRLQYRLRSVKERSYIIAWNVDMIKEDLERIMDNKEASKKVKEYAEVMLLAIELGSEGLDTITKDASHLSKLAGL